MPVLSKWGLVGKMLSKDGAKGKKKKKKPNMGEATKRGVGGLKATSQALKKANKQTKKKPRI